MLTTSEVPLNAERKRNLSILSYKLELFYIYLIYSICVVAVGSPLSLSVAVQISVLLHRWAEGYPVVGETDTAGKAFKLW